MYFDRKCKITFICNGSTIYSEDYRLTDSEKYPPLSDKGVDEIEKICTFLKKRGVKNDKIYSSPATRSKQSAEMISKLFKQDYEIIEDLHPRKCGGYNGLTFPQIEEKYPDALERMINRTDIPTPDDAEAVSDFIKRVKISINDIISQNQGNRIIIVTHRDIIKAAVCSALNMPDSSLHRIYIKSGSATQISYFENWASLVYCDYIPI
ncbi:histidine phosphatase family protein [bacterium]|nr:histidine phosphatase family protein [bacterium]